jgi:diguanylate cyclase (GGDEF)-like protein/PAS domain S-box-containing protein
LIKGLIEIFKHLTDGAYIVDDTRKMIYFNPVAERISGYKHDEIVGKHCYDNILNHIDEKGTKLCLFGCPLKATIDHQETNKADVYLHHKEGHRVKVRVKTIPLTIDGVRYGIELFNDLTEVSSVHLVKALKEEKHISRSDALTTLKNRRYLNELIEGTTIIKEKNHAILFIDIDDFRGFNNTYGHEVGDKVLKQVSKTIVKNIRTSDEAMRYGGEELVVILHQVSLDEALLVAEKLRILINASYLRLKDKNLSVTVSIGVSLFKEQANLKEAIKHADLAMLNAKKQGKNQVVSYEDIKKVT